jgi:pyrroline-5-carboxylate reductase
MMMLALKPSFLGRSFTARRLSTAVFDKIGFIGAGRMATAMMDPLIKTGLQPADQIQVFDVSTNALAAVKESFPEIQTADTVEQVVKNANLVVCAVKPQNLSPAFFEAMGEINPDTVLLSVIAGKPIQTYLDGGFTKVARSMPNTPAQIGQGMTVWCCTPNLTAEERANIQKVLGSFGKQVYVDDEDFIDISTSISGSGPVSMANDVVGENDLTCTSLTWYYSHHCHRHMCSCLWRP